MGNPARLINNPFAAPSYRYPSDLGTAGSEPYIIFDIRDGVAFDAKSKGTIALYMPPTLKATYGMNYEQQELEADQLIDFAQRSLSNGWGAFAKDLWDTGWRNAGKVANTAFKNSDSRVEQNQRKIVNPHMATLFKGVKFRTFQFDFQMMAKNADESKAIQDIIFNFKYAMHPDIVDPSSNLATRYYFYPDNFLIGLFSPADKYLFKISTCVLTDMSVDYAGSGVPSFFQDTGAPVDVRMSLSFTELEFLTKQRISKGY